MAIVVLGLAGGGTIVAGFRVYANHDRAEFVDGSQTLSVPAPDKQLADAFVESCRQAVADGAPVTPEEAAADAEAARAN